MTVAVAAGSFKAWGTMKISTVCVMTMATSWPLRAMAMVIMGIAFWHRIISTRLTQAISIRRACACCKKMRVDINLLHLIITYYKNIGILDAIICWRLYLLTFGLTKTATITKLTDFFWMRQINYSFTSLAMALAVATGCCEVRKTVVATICVKGTGSVPLAMALSLWVAFWHMSTATRMPRTIGIMRACGCCVKR